jgi:hypothetical protein
MSDAIKAEIKQLENRRFQAMIDSDFDTLDKLLGDDLATPIPLGNPTTMLNTSRSARKAFSITEKSSARLRTSRSMVTRPS